MGPGEGTGRCGLAVCLLRSVSLTFRCALCLFQRSGAGEVGGVEKVGCHEEEGGSKRRRKISVRGVLLRGSGRRGEDETHTV